MKKLLAIVLIIVTASCTTVKKDNHAQRILLNNNTGQKVTIFLNERKVTEIKPWQQKAIRFPQDCLVTLAFRIGNRSIWDMDLFYSREAPTYPYVYRGGQIMALGSFSYDN